MLKTSVAFSISINGKFVAQVDMPAVLQGDPDAILAYLREHLADLNVLKGSEKKLEQVTE